MSDRLKDLQRQRALAQEQLAWLDREIARESGAVPSPAPAPAATPMTPPAAGPAHAVTDAEALLAQYRSKPESLQGEVKRGCFLYFFGALGLVALGLLAFYLLHRHP